MTNSCNKPQSFVIPIRLPGLNEIINAARTHYRKSAKLKRDTEIIIGKAIVDHHIKPMDQVYFRFTWVEKNKRRDKDNIAAGVKFIFDALVDYGILKNDGWQEIIDWDNEFTTSKKPEVIVEMFPEKPK